WRLTRPFASTSRGPGGRTPCTSSSRRMPGGCRSSEAGASRTRPAADRIGLAKRILRDGRRLQIPDFLGVFLDCAVARKPAGAGDVDEGLSRPRFRIRIARIKVGVGPGVVLEVREVPVVIAAFEQGVVD